MRRSQPVIHLLHLQIPMLGITRSLNAHVSGAMAMWTYTMQHLPAR